MELIQFYITQYKLGSPDLGSGAARCEGSSPFIRTTHLQITNYNIIKLLFYYNYFHFFFSQQFQHDDAKAYHSKGNRHD